MSDSMDFSLGLDTQNFLGPLSGAAGQIASFGGITLSAGAVVAGVVDAISRGSALDDLSAKIGESAGNIYLLQRGFDRVGVGGGAVEGIVLRLQKSLGGLKEGGGQAGAAFGLLGLK